MNRPALILLACLPLVGFTSCRTRPEPLPPAPLDVDPVCWQACDIEVPRWSPTNPDDPAAWDQYPAEVTAPLKAKLDRCSEVHLRACQQALRRGAELKLYKLVPKR